MNERQPVEKTEGGRTAAEIVERARTIEVRHYQNWAEERTTAKDDGQIEDLVSELERDFHPVEETVEHPAPKKGFRLRLPNLFPEGISVFGVIFREIDRKTQAESKAERDSRKLVEQRLNQLNTKR